MSKPWDENLFGCFANIPVCLVASLCPGGLCIVQATAVDKATKKQSGKIVPCLLVCALEFIGGALNRETIRKAYNLEGGLGKSLGTWCLCGPCAACQEYRETQARN